MKVPLGGGTPSSLASGQNSVEAIAIDDTSIYWTTITPTGTVMKASLAGGQPTTVASDQNFPASIAVDATNVYWANRGSSCSGVSCTGTAIKTVLKAQVDGGTGTTLWTPTAPPAAIAVDATNVYWTNEPGASSPGAVMKVPLSGGTATPLAPRQSGDYSTSLAIDANNVYWNVANLSSSLTTMMQVPIGGGTPVVIASGQPGYGIVVNGATIFWINTFGGGNILAAPVGGQTLTTVASGVAPGAIAVDATSVYWTSATNGTVMKITRK